MLRPRTNYLTATCNLITPKCKRVIDHITRLGNMDLLQLCRRAKGRRSLRFCCLYHQPFCFRIIRATGKISKQLYVSKASANQMVPELTTRVNRMFEMKTSRLAFFDQDPFVSHAIPAV